jgi:hypothetical protein
MAGKNLIMLVLLLIAVQLNAQIVKDVKVDVNTADLKGSYKGYLTMGIRNTISTFNGGSFDYNGMGIGGHFRVPIIPRINTEWYADYITNNIGGMGHRTDVHIGWSVMYYVISPYKVQHTSREPFTYLRKFNPFVETGHCFDYGGIYRNGDQSPAAKRWSSAVQAGFGTHYNLTPRFDLTLKAQYMMHLGNDIEGHVRNGVLEIEEHEHGGIEGHLLFSFSVNYKLVRIWTKG